MSKTLIRAICLTLLPSFALAQDAGNAENGEKVFKKCHACHDIGEGAQNKVGPELNGIVGRPVASVADFQYSKGMKDFADGDKTWTPEELDAFIAKPRDHVPGTKMTFAGLKKDQERADVIAYLQTFSQ